LQKVIARPFNIYGPRQSGRAIIPTIITQVLKNNSHVKLGKITPTRDFTYVSDTCEIIERIIKSKKSIGQEINIGSGKEISIKDLYKKILQIMKVRFKIK
jgi:nucleoside-diphosphate-sugar epimerase